MVKIRYGAKPMNLNTPVALRSIRLSGEAPGSLPNLICPKMHLPARKDCTVPSGLKPFIRIQGIKVRTLYMPCTTMKITHPPYLMTPLQERGIWKLIGHRDF